MKAALLAALAAALLVALDPGGLLGAFERRTLDARHRSHARPTPSSERIVILEIGEESIARLAPFLGRWPWPRSVHAEVIDYLAQDGASAIGFDLLFAESTNRREVDAATWEALAALAAAADIAEVRDELSARLQALQPQRGDAELVAAVAAAGNVFPAAAFADDAATTHWPLVPERATPLVGAMPVATDEPAATHRLAVLPFPELAQAARGIGHINVLPDADGSYRRYAPLIWWRDSQRAVPALGVAIAAYVKGVDAGRVRRQHDGLWLGDLRLPLNADGSAWIPYQGGSVTLGERGRESFRSVYRHIPYEQVLASKDLRATGQPTPLPPGTFRDKIVLISALAAGLADLRSTPFSAVTPGIELHANIIDGILAGRVLRAPDGWMAFSIMLAACLLVALSTRKLRLGAGLAATAVLAVALATALWTAFGRGWILPLVPPLVAMALTWAGVLLLRALTAERERRWLRDAFGHYLAPTVLDELLRAPGRLRLGGERREMSVLFSDIVGFTSLSERLSPEDVGSLLNAYLDRMTACVLETCGTLDKFVGDAVMAEWNAPLAQADHAARACDSALRMLDEIDRRDSPWRLGGVPIDIRIGINSGEMLVGNMGSPQVFDYTVLGNEVNTAARLEPLNKVYGSRIIVADSTRQAAERAYPQRFAFRPLGPVLLKGRAQALQIHQLVGLRAALQTSAAASLAHFDAALAHYLAGRFDQALPLFHAAQQLQPDDGACQRFAAHCQDCIDAPPGQWDGVYQQTEK